MCFITAFTNFQAHKEGVFTMFEQVKLDYATNALEPWIDQVTIETHYGKHHVTYTKNFNDLVEKAGLTDKSVEEILGNLDKVDESIRQGLKNQGGGYYNHNLYFEMFSPNPAKAPTSSPLAIFSSIASACFNAFS